MKKNKLKEFLYLPKHFVKGSKMPKLLFEVGWSHPEEELDDYDYNTSVIEEWMKGAKKFDIRVVNFGWRKIEITGIVECASPDLLLYNILPKTDNSFRVYKKYQTLYINNFHHDSPIGEEWYIVTRRKNA